LATDLAEELAERIPMGDGQRGRRVSKQRALLKALVAKALNGDTRAASIVLQLVERVVAPEIARDGPGGDDLSADDRQILDHYVAARLGSRK
jgi:hypothetical protein